MSSTQKVVVLPSKGSPLQHTTAPIPTAVAGSVVIRVLATPISPNTNAMFAGKLPIPLHTPLVPGSSAVGRVHSVGPDATSFRPGQLVIADFFVRARDDRDASVLMGYMAGHDAGSEHLMKGEWKDGSFAEYARWPVESVYALDEDLLCRRMGYSLPDLAKFAACFVTAGGFCEIGLKPGDDVIIAPATGHFGSAAIPVALAMGARVIAAARGEGNLSKIRDAFGSSGRLVTVKLSGDAEADTKALKDVCLSKKGADSYVDWSPPAAANSTHIGACLAALRPFGRVVFMGGIFAHVKIPYFSVIRNSIRIQGRYMYEREHAEQVVRLAETGLLKLGPGEGSGTQVHAGFGLDNIEEAFNAAEGGGLGHMVVVEP